jgi:cardiolipin synthase
MQTLLICIIWGISIFSAGHALLTKRDPRAGLGWIIACLALPGIGAISYWLLGVNRIRTKARELQTQGQGLHWMKAEQDETQEALCSPDCSCLLNLSDEVTRRPLTFHNKVDALYNGEQAYPAMLEAISNAEQTIFLSSYIFQADKTGRLFVRELTAAAKRGVDVRVLIDAFGERYSFPRVRKLFRGSQIKSASFLPPSLSRRSLYLNMRNHRKLLIVDSRLGFTGGMNIWDRHLAAIKNNPRRVIDVHFRLEGPVCSQLREAFLEDWHFATNEIRQFKKWPEAPKSGNACCRGISAGPNELHEKLNWILIGALSCARERVRIMTPYFIPSRAQLAAITAASLRGVQVEVLLPKKNNLPFVDWASRAYLWELLEHDTKAYYQPPPFVHSKMLLVDDKYALVGSANMDPRSLRLNFEFNIEIIDPELVGELIRHFDHARMLSKEVFQEQLEQRSIPERLRNSFCKLFSPYL